MSNARQKLRSAFRLALTPTLKRTGKVCAGSALPALACLALASCTPTPAPNPHYVLGAPYQANGFWWYPRERLDLDETGLAAVYPSGHPPLTSDGEVFGQGAFAAAHPSLQLPAIARLTDLETGRSVLVRINDRGNPTPHRLVEVTRRVADLLGIPADGVAQVRLTVLPAASQAAADRLPGAPLLPIAAAPRGVVQAAALAPPPGARAEAGRAVAATPTASAADAPAAPERLPETVTQGTPHPGRLFVRLGSFEFYEYAAIQRARMFGLSPHIDSVFEGKVQTFRVMVGPLGSVDQADSALDQALRANMADARIVVE